MSKPGTRPGPEPSELRGPQLLGLRFSWDSFAQMHDRRQETRVPLEPSNFIRGRSVWTMGVTVDGARKRRGTKAAAKSTATKAVEEATPECENRLSPKAVWKGCTKRWSNSGCWRSMHRRQDTRARPGFGSSR